MSNYLTTKEGSKVFDLVRSEEKLNNAKVFGAYIQTPIAVTEDGYIGIITPKLSDSAWDRFTEKTGSKRLDNFDLNIIHINDVVAFDLLIDKKSGLGGAIAGGALFGDGGAVVGAMLSKEKSKNIDLQIRVNDFQTPQILVPLFHTDGAGQSLGKVIFNPYAALGRAVSSTVTGAAKQRAAEIQELMSLLETLLQREKSSRANDNVVVQQASEADELAKFKKLLDDGVITQEEFDAKKKQLLGL